MIVYRLIIINIYLQILRLGKAARSIVGQLISSADAVPLCSFQHFF